MKKILWLLFLLFTFVFNFYSQNKDSAKEFYSVEELKEDFNKKVRKILNAEPANQISSVINKPIKETKPLTGSRFAKYADMGDGFSANQLAEEQDNEKIFELVLLDNNKAKFKVVNNRSAQLLALSNPNLYLNKTCIYDSVPTVSSNIITETEGDLKREVFHRVPFID